MQTLISVCKTVRLGKVLAAFAAGFILLLNVACSNGNAVGARPNNPPVQMGGQNNPHKAGGDGYSEYQMSTDPNVAKRDRASSTGFDWLVASTNKAEQSFSVQNTQNGEVTSRRSKGTMSNATKEARQVPAEEPQKVIDRSDPEVKILEKVGGAFKEAGKHLTGATEQSIEQSGVVQQDMSH